MRTRNVAMLVGMVTLLACQSSDFGTPCRLIPATTQLPTNVIDDQPVSADFVASNVTSCDDLICIKSPQRSSGYCSGTCASDSECPSGFVCRTLTFDPTFLNQLPDTIKKTLQDAVGSIGTSRYCATSSAQ